MNVSQDLSIIELILNASLVVKLVMLLLIGVSLVSWYWIFRKAFTIRDARVRTDQFERDFWSGGDLNTLYESAVNNRHVTGALERIFEAGYREFTKLRGQTSLDTKAVVDGVRRAMRATYQRELDDLDSHLSFLASVGSVSPYVGLLGTVWGIMQLRSDYLRQFRQSLHTTALRMTSIGFRCVSRASWKSFRIFCRGRSDECGCCADGTPAPRRRLRSR